jgi:hypothetical protein
MRGRFLTEVGCLAHSINSMYSMGRSMCEKALSINSLL